jgi:hypothetical protein
VLLAVLGLCYCCVAHQLLLKLHPHLLLLLVLLLVTVLLLLLLSLQLLCCCHCCYPTSAEHHQRCLMDYQYLMVLRATLCY